jgi:hypothetical protein
MRSRSSRSSESSPNAKFVRWPVTYAISTIPPARRTERTTAAVDLRFVIQAPVVGQSSWLYAPFVVLAEGGNDVA